MTRHSVVRSARRRASSSSSYSDVARSRERARASDQWRLLRAGSSPDEVLLGVDTHLDLNVAVALDQLWAEKPGRVEGADHNEGL